MCAGTAHDFDQYVLVQCRLLSHTTLITPDAYYEHPLILDQIMHDCADKKNTKSGESTLILSSHLRLRFQKKNLIFPMRDACPSSSQFPFGDP